MDERTNFYNKYKDKFEQAAAKLLGVPKWSHEVEETVSDAWLQVFKSWDSFKELSKRYTWANTILHRTAIKYIRKKEAQRRKVKRYFSEYGIDTDIDTGGCLRCLLASSNDFDYTTVEYNLLDFDDIIARYDLTENDIEILRYLLAEMSPAEIIEKLQIESSAGYARIFRLKKKLNQVFDDVP